MSKWSARDLTRLQGVHPRLFIETIAILRAMELLHYPMFVVEGLRTTERQLSLYAQGRTKPGPIVSNVDGLKVVGTHQPHGDGFGHAVDCAFIDDPGTKEDETYDPRQPWELYGLMAQKRDLVWGGTFKGLGDFGHIELPK